MVLREVRLLLAALLLTELSGLLPPRGLPGKLVPCRATADASTALVVLGGCGDLARNKLFPGLLRLHRQGELPSSFLAVGCGRETRSTDGFRTLLRETLGPQASTDFLAMVEYRQVQSYCSRACLARLFSYLQSQRCDRVLVYFALPPTVFSDTLLSLAACDSPDLQLVLEKPIGRDAASCRDLLAALRRVNCTRPPLLVDHYLGKEAIRSLPALRFRNSILEPSLSRHHVHFVEGKSASASSRQPPHLP